MDVAEGQLTDRTTDLDAVLDRPYGAWRWIIFAICGVAMALEGFDMYMLGAIVPALAAGLGVEPPAISVVFVMQGIGLAMGYTFVAPLADRIGRRPLILYCVLGFGLATWMTAFVASLTMVAFLRLVAFIFFGGIMPNVITLISELSPRHIRPRQIILVSTCFAMGAAMGSALAPVIVGRMGWTGVFLFGGIAPLILLPIMFFTLPESPRFLVMAGRSATMVNRVLRRFAPDVRDDTTYVLTEPLAARASVKALFGSGRTATTLLFMLAGGMMIFVSNAVASWAPTFWHLQAGYAMGEAAALFALSSVGAILWPAVMIQLVKYWGLKRTLIFCFTAGGLCMLVYMVQPFNKVLAGFMAITFGAFVVGSISGLYAFVTASYPTQIRSTALGWTSGAGRLLAIVGPAVGGLFLAKGVGPVGIALLFGLPMFVAAICIALVREAQE